MEPIVGQSSLSRIESLLAKKSLSQAESELKRVDIKSLSEADYAYHCLLHTEISLSLANYELGSSLDFALAYYKYGHDNLRYAYAKFLQGWKLMATGCHEEATEALLESYASYKRCDDLKGAARVVNKLAYLDLLKGDLEAAAGHLQICMDIYSKLDLGDARVAFVNNLATIYRLAGRIRKSISLYSSFAHNIGSMTTQFKYSFYTGYGLSLAIKGDITGAVETIELVNCLEPEFERENAIYLEHLGWIHLIRNEFYQAKRYLESSLKISFRIAPHSDLISQTKRLLADANLGLKNYDLAQKYAEEALAVAEKINERAEIAACRRVFAQTSLHRGEKEKAKEWFKKASEMFSMISSRYELAVTRYLAAVSGLYGEGERAALLYLAKEYFESEDIRPYIEKANRELESGSAHALRPSGNAVEPNGFCFVGQSPAIVKIRALAENISRSSMTVFLTGPTGSGKDQLARYIHYCSGRSGEFVSVNCAAIPEGMVESELFGFRKGAFTGAGADKPGLFEMAHDGTFYLNEIADTQPQFQAKLLEIIESRAVRRLGSTDLMSLNFRVIAATNQNLETLLKEGKFRLDLYHRLNEIPISLPPLSERPQDIILFVRHFLEQCGVAFDGNGYLEELRELCSILELRDWPGNVRELRAEINRLHHLSGGDIGGMLTLLREPSLTERDLLLQTLEKTGWNQSATARELGMTEGTIRYRMKKAGLGNNDQ